MCIEANILGVLGNHFQQATVNNRIPAMVDQGRQIEGWFKGEMMYALRQSDYKDYRVEVGYPQNARNNARNNARTKCDFVIRSNDNMVGIETKAVFRGRQRGVRLEDGQLINGNDAPWELRKYISTGDQQNPSGIAIDAQRLLTFKRNMCLIYAYGNDPAQVYNNGQNMTWNDAIDNLTTQLNTHGQQLGFQAAHINGSPRRINININDSNKKYVLYIIAYKVSPYKVSRTR